jgi:hypothetical protein
MTNEPLPPYRCNDSLSGTVAMCAVGWVLGWFVIPFMFHVAFMVMLFLWFML